MTSMDFNDVESRGAFELIPAGTICKLGFKIKPGAHGDGGWLTKSNTSDAAYINAELIVLEGPYKNRRIFQNMVVSGGKADDNGNSIAGNISRQTLRAVIESARGIKPDDESQDAKAKRIINGYGDFNGMEFVGQIGIEKGSGGYPDKNKLAGAVTPGHKDYDAVMAGKGQASPPAQTASAPKAAVPAWAA